jgi:hypothetical protein
LLPAIGLKSAVFLLYFSLSFTLCDMQALLRVRNSLTEMIDIFGLGCCPMAQSSERPFRAGLNNVSVL